MDQELLDGIRQIVREEISGVKTDVSSLKTNVSSLKTDVAEMKPQLEENTQIVRALLANSEEHGALLEQLDLRVSRLEGNEKRLEKLENNFIHHRHPVEIAASEPEYKDSYVSESDS